MKYDVFISYSSHDQKVVEGLCAYLEQHKIRCFVAYRDIPRGVVWASALVEALQESRMMVVVFSEHFNNSDQVDREIELASEDHKPILTFRITDNAFKGAKKYYLKNINWIDAFPHPEAVFGAVVDNVAKLIDIKLTKDEDFLDVTLTPIKEDRIEQDIIEKAIVEKSKHRQKMRKEVEEGLIAAWRVIKWPFIILSVAFVVMVVGVIIDQKVDEKRDANVAKELAEGKGRNGIYEVGDYYNINGKEGVVFDVWDGGRHGKIISLDQAEATWDSRVKWDTVKKEHINGIRIFADSKVDGKINTDKVMSCYDSQYFDSFIWCRTKGADWYLPAVDELIKIFDNYSKLDSTLHQHNAASVSILPSSWYWSSTEYYLMPEYTAWFVNRSGPNNWQKGYKCYVRAVATF